VTVANHGVPFHVEQDLYTAITAPMLELELVAQGEGFDVELDLEPMEGGGSNGCRGEDGGTLRMTRSFEDDVDIPTSVAAAIKAPRRFRLEAGKPVRLSLAMRGRLDAAKAVGEVGIRSERGRRCVVENPWPGREVVVVRDGVAAETVSGKRLVLATCAGEELRFAPR